MRQALLYETPEQFAHMMMKHLEDGLGMQVKQKDGEGEPLLLEVIAVSGGTNGAHAGPAPGDGMVVSLHSTYQTYCHAGDLNLAINYLNGIISTVMYTSNHEEVMRIDSAYLFPDIRETEYVTEAGKDMEFVTEEPVPGLSVIFLEIKSVNNKIVNNSMLALNPRLTEERMKRLAYSNLRGQGWTKPSMQIPSPALPSCTIQAYVNERFPLSCQFLNQSWLKEHMSESFLIAFTNRKQTMVLRSAEAIETAEAAVRMAKHSKFDEIVRRTYRVMPQPVSEAIYWVHNGRYVRLDKEQPARM
ncbi:hypothetical protein ACFO9Q_03105 [Paenibacillus sp. GCM10023252]|uniref:hypothetical protein n=1 Tax=Paenibacillus sp. GCM10023252 TaxID=3252649 RepID=UPI003614ABDB